jgi:hypothetical protein
MLWSMVVSSQESFLIRTSMSQDASSSHEAFPFKGMMQLFTRTIWRPRVRFQERHVVLLIRRDPDLLIDIQIEKLNVQDGLGADVRNAAEMVVN